MNYDEKQNRWAEMAELVNDARREVEREYERMVEKTERMGRLLKIMEHADELLEENELQKSELEQQQGEIDSLHQQLEDKDKRQKETDALLKEKDTQLNELGKFSVGVAKKSSQEGLEKAFRTYINTSKRKTQAKREVAHAQLLDFIATAKLEMPEDIMELLNHLDDEQPETKVVNVAGNYNDIHDNGSVNRG